MRQRWFMNAKLCRNCGERKSDYMSPRHSCHFDVSQFTGVSTPDHTLSVEVMDDRCALNPESVGSILD
jgi:hypothetical protein